MAHQPTDHFRIPVVLVGPSRVYLGAHWASDVLGAYVLSGVCLGIGLWIHLYVKGALARPTRIKQLRKYIKYIK